MKIFKEEQHFNQSWLIALILISLLIAIGVILKTYVNNPSSYSTAELIAKIGFAILVSGLIFIFKLTSRIDEKGFHYKFFPFHWSFKLIEWSEIDKASIRIYKPLTEYGGWGIKGGTVVWPGSKGKAINVSGNIGIQLELKNGKKLLIGTQKQSEVEAVLATYKMKIN